MKGEKILAVLIAMAFCTPVLIAENTSAKGTSDGIDVGYVSGIIENLSNVIFEYPPGEIPKGRCFGTWGEQYAANYIIKPEMSNLGLNPIMQEIGGLNDDARVPSDWGLTVRYINRSSGEVIEKEIPKEEIFPFPDEMFVNCTNIENADVVLWEELEKEGNESNGELGWWIALIPVNDWRPVGTTGIIPKIVRAWLLGAKAFILYDKYNEHQNVHLMFPPRWGWPWGNGPNPGYPIPGLSINGSLGREIRDMRLNPNWKVRLDFLENHTWKDDLESYNVIGKIDAEGTDETILIGAHYDGWWCQASVDNAVGPATMLGIAKWFSNHPSIPLKYDLEFVAFGGEEYIAQGSEYFAMNTDENIKYMINLDMFAQKDTIEKTKLYYYSTNDDFREEVRGVIEEEGYGDYAKPKDEDYGGDDSWFYGINITFSREPYEWYHRDGDDHDAGDVVGNIDEYRLETTGNLVLDVVKHFAIEEEGEPKLEYHSHTIDDDNYGDSEGDGDGYVEPGETIELKVKLKNTGDAEANNVYAILSTSVSWITITDNRAGYGNIPAGSIKECNDEYVFHVGNPGGLPEVILVKFDLEIHSDEGTWSDYFWISVYPEGGSPNLEYYDHSIDDDNYGESSGDGDGKAEEGETIEMPVWLKNSGDADAHNVYAYISTSSNKITITDNYEEYPDIHAGSIKECYDDFGFYVNTGLGSLDGILYVKIDIEMHSSEGTWNDYFHVAIYPSGNPYLEYYDHSIDDDNYGESSGDGDGKVEPGETIELKVKLKNTGDAEANNVYAILSTTTSWIDITDNYAQYGDIPAGSIKECNDEYVFHVGNPGGELGRIYPVTFNLDIYSDEGTWSDSFVINVYG